MNIRCLYRDRRKSALFPWSTARKSEDKQDNAQDEHRAVCLHEPYYSTRKTIMSFIILRGILNLPLFFQTEHYLKHSGSAYCTVPPVMFPKPFCYLCLNIGYIKVLIVLPFVLPHKLLNIMLMRGLGGLVLYCQFGVPEM